MLKAKGGLAIIFWGPHSPSTDDFGRKFSAPVYKIHYLLWKRWWLAPIKYIPMCLKTWSVLSKQKPQAVFVINSPVFAVMSIFPYCKLKKIPYIINVHGHSFYGRKWAWSLPLHRFFAKKAMMNLVGFPKYKELFESWGAKALILERPQKQIDPLELVHVTDQTKFTVTMVSTFSADEPVDLVIQAASQLSDVQFYILGNKQNADKSILSAAPENVVFPGYLKFEDYWNQLNSSQVIITLTTTPYSLISGGVEAMSLKKPMILSRQPALTDYFTKGAIFVDHSVESIVEAVHLAKLNENQLAMECAELAAEKQNQWDESFEFLLSLLGDQM